MAAFAYLRKSSVRDPKREVSHEMQESAVRELAHRHNDNNGALTILSDWDLSGRLGADKRPGYRALLTAIESGRCTAVYSYSLSRLGRSVAELARLISDCDKRGIPLRLYADSMDTSTASGRLLAHVLASVAAFEADVAGERIRAANGAKLARDEKVGTQHAFGEKPGEDADAVLAAFREAGSYSAAAKLLNERGVRPRNSKKRINGTERAVWWPSSVQVVVRRMDPTVKLQRPTRGVRAGGRTFTLARLLRCPTCGTRLTGQRDRVDGPNGGRTRYACRLGTVIPHPRITVSEHLILPAIQAEVAHLRTPKQVVAEQADTATRAGLEQRRERILDMYETGAIDKADSARRLAAVDEKLAGLDLRRVVQAVPEIDWAWPTHQQNAVLQALFEDIRLDPDTFAPVGFTWAVPEWRAP